MPTFIDWHEAGQGPAGGLSEEERRKLESRVREGIPDQFGVVDHAVILDQESGRMYCLLEAPDEEAIRKHHEATGVPVDEVHRADAIL